MSEDYGQLVRLGDSGPGGTSRAIAQGRRLFGLDAEALAACMVETGEPAWRGQQLAEALYRQRITELSEITTLPKPLRQRVVDQGWFVGRPKIAQLFQSVDGTERYLVEGTSRDGVVGAAETVETVWMPEGDGGESGDGSDADDPLERGAPSFPRPLAERAGERRPQSAPVRDEETRREGSRWRATLCISSQVGCAVNCQFCLTAKLGFQRNLSTGEIAGQVLAVFDRHSIEVGRDRVNLVFMGMGEPFLNYDNFMAAVRLLVREVGLSPQRMTVSTSGIVPGIERFATEPAEFRPKLAISLNAPNDTIRGEIMPINRKWPIQAVVDAVRQVKLRPRERITFEYVLLGGVTDRPEDAREVARLVRRTGLPAKVNLIAWNPGPGISYTTPKPEAVEAFRDTLAGLKIPTYVRKPRGRDIYAACGQLKRTVEG
ncbi:MAG: 23S rRNA (adenine(2503)-C(2))-methyltransferase RlmN [Terracidiphilus sp.]